MHSTLVSTRSEQTKSATQNSKLAKANSSSRRIAELTRFIFAADPKKTANAIKELQSFGPQIIAPVVNAYASDFYSKGIKDHASYQTLVGMVILGVFHEELEAPILKALLHGCGDQRVFAALLIDSRVGWHRTLGEQYQLDADPHPKDAWIKNEKSRSCLRRALQDPLCNCYVLHTLAELRDAQSIQDFFDIALSDSNNAIRVFTAFDGICRSADNEHIYMLRNSFDKIFKRGQKSKDEDEKAFVYTLAFLGLGLQEAGTKPTLTFARELLGNPDRMVRCLACRVIGDRADGQSLVENVAVLLNDKADSVANSALESLGKLKAKSYLPLMKSYCDSKEPVNRISGVRALGSFGSSEDLDTLTAMTNDENKSVRITVAQSLASIGGAVAKKTLKQMFNDADPGVQKAAHEAYDDKWGH